LEHVYNDSVRISSKQLLLSIFAVCGIWYTAAGALADDWESTICAADAAQRAHKLDEAEKLFADALRQAEAFGEGDPKLFMSLRGLADVYHERGEQDKAEQLYLRELRMAEKVGYANQSDPIYLWSALASISVSQGRMAEGEQRYRKALSLVEQQSGPNSAQVAGLLRSIGYCCHRQNHFDDAIVLAQRALKIHGMLEPNSMEVSYDLAQLSTLYQDKHDPVRSDEFEKEALAIRLRLCKPNDPNIVQSLARLANNMVAEHKTDEAIALYETKLMKMGAVAYGPDSFPMSVLLQELGSAYKDKKDYGKAIPLYERALAIRKKTLSKEDSGVADAVTKLADCYLKGGRPAQARQVCQDYLHYVNSSPKVRQEALLKVRKKLAECD
jgi:tetratricopeptide (TPR) repeat protein